ncbi:MAG TPA: hypothetical protein VFK81_06410, partial [Terriglobales bacterium]|nr:hypothetical protein [Terriglobales bacterium]
MRIVVLLAVVLGLVLPAFGKGDAAATASPVVVFAEENFPAADTAAPDVAQLKMLLPEARFATADQLPAALSEAQTRLLVMPYGSAFPEAAWPGIFVFLEHGGNLLALGGKPFTRAAYRDSTDWHLRDYSVRFDLALTIDQWQETPGSAALQFDNNPDVVLHLPRFSWQRAYSPIIRLGSVDIYQRGGSASYLDARLDALAWGVREGRRMAAPAIQIDHLRNRFTGGRWIFVNAELPGDFYGGAGKLLVPMLAEAALAGSQEFTVHPTLPLYLPGEPVQLEVAWQAATPAKTSLTLKITISPEEHQSAGVSRTVTFPLAQPLVLPAPSSKGLHVIEGEMLEGDKIRAVYRSGFWIRDENYLRSGPRLSVNQDYFELDGRPLAVLGTTYMSSDVQRLYFDHPNVYVWDRDLGQISAAGLNMIRTGWWTGWDKFCDENGRPYERTLRTLEAYLMTARRHGLPVQFNFFAFLPDALGGENAYLDPNAVRREQTLISSVVTRFHDVPFLAWDLINEPSFSKHLWQMRPNGDAIELAKWNEWLNRRYPDRAALAAAWNLPLSEAQGTLPLPSDGEFQQRSMYDGPNSLKLYDYFLFAQESFARWAQGMREVIRATGSRQPITVGQDEGGYTDRLSPAFFGKAVDFTTNHSWWQNDSLLWDSLVAKQPGLPMLIQETGLQRELTLGQISRRTPENEAALLERKLALSFVQGSGALEWLWNTNAYTTSGNEAPIGALRADGTEKPEAGVLRDFAAFARQIAPSLRNPKLPAVAVVTSQAAQFSVIQDLQIAAQRNAVRALAYANHQPAYVIAENQVEHLGSPRLAILPSPQALTDAAWQTLLKYVSSGGNLLITGSVGRDEHWQQVRRAAGLKPGAQIEPLTFHSAEMQTDGQTVPLAFDLQKQSWLEVLRFPDGATLEQMAHGHGRIFWAAYPVELAEGPQAADALYSYVLSQVGMQAPFELRQPTPGLLIYPVVLEDSV